MKKFLIASIFSVFLVSSPARADWQYTKWGMSPTEVATAGKGQVSESNGRPGQKIEGLEVGAVGSYRSGSRTFELTFYFDKAGLALVSLDYNESPRCYGLANDLKGVYGEPFSSRENSITVTNTWQDRKSNNFIALLAIGSSCSLTYKPLIDDDASGL